MKFLKVFESFKIIFIILFELCKNTFYGNEYLNTVNDIYTSILASS